MKEKWTKTKEAINRFHQIFIVNIYGRKSCTNILCMTLNWTNAIIKKILELYIEKEKKKQNLYINLQTHNISTGIDEEENVYQIL